MSIFDYLAKQYKIIYLPISMDISNDAIQQAYKKLNWHYEEMRLCVADEKQLFYINTNPHFKLIYDVDETLNDTDSWYIVCEENMTLLYNSGA